MNVSDPSENSARIGIDEKKPLLSAVFFMKNVQALFLFFQIKAALFVVHNCVSDENADNGSRRNGDHQS